MKPLTRKQREALLEIYRRIPLIITYREFRRTVQRPFYDDGIMVQWAGQWLGIEPDGYTHS